MQLKKQPDCNTKNFLHSTRGGEKRNLLSLYVQFRLIHGTIPPKGRAVEQC